MTNKFEKFIHALRSINLKDTERENMRSVLIEYSEHLPVDIKHITPQQRSRFSIILHSALVRRAVPALLILVAIVFGRQSDTSFIAVETPQQTDVMRTLVNNVQEKIGIEAENTQYAVPSVGISGDASADSMGYAGSEESRVFVEEPYKYIPPVPEIINITDTREYLKINYSANIKTRNVPDMVDEIETAVRGVSGRIDYINSGEKWGRVSFVIPKMLLHEFKDEIEELTHSKLYTEDISSQNLLGQKQNIEFRTGEITTSLGSLEQQRNNLDSLHTQIINSIQSQITSQERILNAIRIAIGVEKDENKLRKLEAKEDELVEKIAALNRNKASENSNYIINRNSLSANINRQEGNLDNVIEEDIQLTDNVETVQGYIDVQWISLWSIGEAFSPTPMWLNVVIFALLLWWYLEHRAKVYI